MTKRINGRLYFIERIKYDRKAHQFYVERNEDGSLYTGRYYRKTTLLKEDLPEYFIRGRYYKRFGYLSTKGIVDLKYLPSYWTNHFLKDDFLLISYTDKIQLKESSQSKNPYYLDYDHVGEYVYGNDILSILEGAQKYSNYDIAPILKELEHKIEWCISKYGLKEFEDTQKWFKKYMEKQLKTG